MLQARIKMCSKHTGNKNNCKESERLGFSPKLSGKEQPVCLKKRRLSVEPVLLCEILWGVGVARGETWGLSPVVGTSFCSPTHLSRRGLLLKYSWLPENISPAVPRISKSVSWAC